MGCALEIGWVNKERGAVSFTWLILLTILFALSQSLSHAPFLILYFYRATPPNITPLSHLHSLPLYLLSLPPLLPLCLSFLPHLSHLCQLFSETAVTQWLAEVSVSCWLKGFFSLCVLGPVCVHAKLWHKQVNFLTCSRNCPQHDMK